MDMPVRIMRRFAGRVLDTLYPPRCVACRSSGDWWCASCRGAVERLTNRPCSRCLVAELKFQGMTAVGADLESYLRDWSASFPWAGETTIAIQPMPLAPGRERHRGFNQAAWIAERMRVAWNIPGNRSALLARRPSTFAQADLNHDGKLRKANISGTFVATRAVACPVLLVDDVVTTGSTAGEAAQILMQAGVPRVYLATLAVGK